MTTKRSSIKCPARAACLAAAVFMAGWSVPATSQRIAGTPAPRAAAAPTSGDLVLEYKMPAGKVLRYQDESEVLEVTDVMGQSMESHATAAAFYSFMSKGRKDQNYLLGVTIDDWSMTVTGPRGDMSPDMKPLKGRGFDMVLSPLGVEVDVSGAEDITYEFTAGPRSVASAFKIFFPDLPGKPVKIGDSWPSSFVVEDKSATTSMRVDVQSVNTLEGLETVDGMECARISAKHTGTISGTGSREGLELGFSGTLKGTDLWHFAIKEGLYVRSAGETVNEMTIAVSGPQAMTVPVTQTRKSEVKLAGL